MQYGNNVRYLWCKILLMCSSADVPMCVLAMIHLHMIHPLKMEQNDLGYIRQIGESAVLKPEKTLMHMVYIQ